MKSYTGLWEKCISVENRKEAIRQAKHSKRIRNIIKKRGLTDEELLEKSFDWLVHYKNAKHTPIIIEDGITHKKRTIIVPTLEELIVQHCIVQALKPVFMRGMYEHSYASIPGKGAHKGKKFIQRWIQKDPKNTKYVLKLDIRHFFDSIPHDKLMKMLVWKIHDVKMIDILYEIISVTKTGIPLGFYTSQWLSNWYLMRLDHKIKEEWHVKYYVRYMDDMVLFSSSKKKLRNVFEKIHYFLFAELGLYVKRNYQIFRLDGFKGSKRIGRDLDFMGFRFFRDRVILRKSIMLKATRKARKIAKKNKPTVYDARQMLSYLGWIKATNTYNMYLARIKPYIDFGQMKHIISITAKGVAA